MEQRPNDRMLERTILFVTLSIGILWIHSYFFARPARKPAQPAAEQQVAGEAEGDGKVDGDDKAEGGGAEVVADGESPSEEAEADEPEEDVAEIEPAVEVPEQYITLGSVDSQSPYRMLVTFTNRGAAVARTELSSPRYLDTEERYGYLGHLVVNPDQRGLGCPVQVVGNGTPAQKAGLKPGDLITSLDGVAVTGARSLVMALQKTRPGQSVSVEFLRAGKKQTAQAILARRPAEVMRPEGDDPLSFLFTFFKIDASKLPDLQEDVFEDLRHDRDVEIIPRDPVVNAELPGVALRDANWEVVSHDVDEVVFRQALPKHGLEVTKTYRLAETSSEGGGDVDYPAYHLKLEVSVRNGGEEARNIAYQLDGPTGLPTEGAWYSRKAGPGWGMYGLRDVLISLDGKSPNIVRCAKIGEDEWGTLTQSEDSRLTYIGVDAQYFSSVLIPQREEEGAPWFSRSHAIRVGAYNKELVNRTNTSCRVVSIPTSLGPRETLTHQYDVFTGPKRPPLLKQYGLGDTISYGWFWWVAIPMLHVLHFFEGYIVFNYGLAIILLTVLVRSCMFPLSRKQALGAQKMQEIQPELKKISEKYKKDPEALRHAQQELFRRHNYNPLSGCLPIFVQLPIFIGLYKALMVDVELRGAALLGQGIRWCSNLAAPDMLYDWSGFWAGIGWPEFNTGAGFLHLGPYFNILPLVTVALFLVQQKMFMPPPADEQAKMQQKMMTFMMLFMGLLFFKVASGLCIYFIASSLWGVAERKLLPKKEGGGDTPAAESPSAPPAPRPPRRGPQGPAKRPKKKPRKR